MNNKIPRTPFSTALSGAARETEIRLKNIFSGPKKRPPILFLVLMFSVCIFCGNLVSCQVASPPEQVGAPEPAHETDFSSSVTDMISRYARREGVYTIFLAAADAGDTRTDTMMVLRYDTKNQTVGLVSIPRDTLVARESGNPHLVYGPGGLEQRIADVSSLLGIPIDYYIRVNLEGFTTLVDELGGIDFYVPCDMDYDDPAQNLSIHFKEGLQTLSGQQAMAVARFRKNNDGSGYSDIGRTQTQQQLLVALTKKVLSWNSLNKVNRFVDLFHQNVETSIPLDDMLYFASCALGLDSADIETATLPGRGDGIYQGSSFCYELEPEETLDMVNRLLNPYVRELTPEDLNLVQADSYMW